MEFRNIELFVNMLINKKRSKYLHFTNLACINKKEKKSNLNFIKMIIKLINTRKEINACFCFKFNYLACK